MSRRKSLNLNTINRHLLSAEYAVRGELAIRAEELSEVSETAKSYACVWFASFVYSLNCCVIFL